MGNIYSGPYMGPLSVFGDSIENMPRPSSFGSVQDSNENLTSYNPAELPDYINSITGETAEGRRKRLGSISTLPRLETDDNESTYPDFLNPNNQQRNTKEQLDYEGVDTRPLDLAELILSFSGLTKNTQQDF